MFQSPTRRLEARAVLGAGGLGVVHRAYDPQLGREVALKTLPGVGPEERLRLKDEFRALVDLHHPHLVQLHELVADDVQCFFTMELVEGVDLLAHVRGGPVGARTDEGPVIERLVAALRQLASGLQAIHAAGLLHRDVKPSNVLVTPGGRVVLLDFGLAASAVPSGSAGGFAGSERYVAPEQAWLGTASPASDWYSVGAVAFEALTGHVPFEEAGPTMLVERFRRAPALDALAASGAPAWLGELVRDLLAPAPGARPDGAQVLARLHAGEAPPPQIDGPHRSPAALVGRARETAFLEACVARLREGAAEIVHVHGPSGIGKTALLSELLRRVEASGGALVLHGRCHPHESVPYRALDRAVDDLARHLTGAVFEPPEDAPALVRLFPVLDQVPALQAPGRPLPLEPAELRRRGVSAFRDLVARLCARLLVVLWIDDLQWGDPDSLVLLRALVRAPAPRLLLLLSYRDEDQDQSPFLRELAAEPLEEGPGRRELALGPLEVAAATALADRLLAELGVEGAPDAAALAREAGGSPFFVSELARHRASTAGPVRLGEVVGRRLDRLEPAARRALELIALAARPLRHDLVLSASGLDAGGRTALATLERRSLVRQVEVDGAPALLAYHDRIREAVVGGLDARRLREGHAELADVLASLPDATPEVLLVHCKGAGRREAAAGHAEAAGERASRALAFRRAAELYGEALELHGRAHAAWPDLLVRRAEALANAGLGHEAGPCFVEAADEVAARAPARRTEVQSLRRRGAEQLLRSGRLDEGLAVERRVLSEVGVSLPSSEAWARWSSLLRRVRLLARGLAFRRREPQEVPERVQLRLDALWGASTLLSLMNPSIADTLGTRHLAEALAAGDRSRVLRALAYEAAFEAHLGGGFLRRRARKKLAVLADLAAETRAPYDQAWYLLGVTTTSWASGEWPRAEEAGEGATRLFRHECRGASWETAVAELYTLSAMAFRGDLARLGDRLPDALREAEGRGDLFAANNYRLGHVGTVRLARDQVDDALELARLAEESWPRSVWHAQRYYHVVLMVQLELYRGDAWGAWRQAVAAWPGLREAMFHWHEVPWLDLLHLRARAALAVLHRGGSGEGGWSSWRLRRWAEGATRAIARSGTPIAGPLAAGLRAALAHQRDRHELACGELLRAVEGFDAAGMALHREAARYRLGLLRGQAGEAEVARSLAWMASQGVVRPEALVDVLAPGLPRAPVGRR